MPVALPEDAYAAWLDPAFKKAADALALAREHTLTGFAHHPVSPRVNATKNDDRALVDPLH